MSVLDCGFNGCGGAGECGDGGSVEQERMGACVGSVVREGLAVAWGGRDE